MQPRIGEVATHQKTQQGLKHECIWDATYEGDEVATHQKTQQGLKLPNMVPLVECLFVATHQKTQQGLKPIIMSHPSSRTSSRNASENPAGIETGGLKSVWDFLRGRNASENPAGIETFLLIRLNLYSAASQRIRKPSRD